MIVSTKIAKMFKHSGFVNIDYLVENKLEKNPSKILNILNRDWRKWVKPLSMFDGGGLDPNFGYETAGASKLSLAADKIAGFYPHTCPESGSANSISFYSDAGAIPCKCALYKNSDDSLVGYTEEKSPVSAGWNTFNITSGGALENIAYILASWWNTYSSNRYYNSVAGFYSCERALAYGTPFPDPAGWTSKPFYLNIEFSIYCTYTKAAPKPKGTIAIHAKLVGII